MANVDYWYAGAKLAATGCVTAARPRHLERGNAVIERDRGSDLATRTSAPPVLGMAFNDACSSPICHAGAQRGGREGVERNGIH